jgi:hypothetical protein
VWEEMRNSAAVIAIERSLETRRAVYQIENMTSVLGYRLVNKEEYSVLSGTENARACQDSEKETGERVDALRIK